jgi:exodeoxyribonuclease VIII
LWAGVPEDIYRQWPGWNKSRLNTLVTRTARRFKWECEHPDKVMGRAAELGTAAHFSVLEPERFPKLYMRSPDPPSGDKWDRRTKEHKQAWIDAQLAAGDRELLAPDEWDMAMGIAASCHDHGYIHDHIVNGTPEVSIQWRDPETSMLLKGRLDLWDHFARCFMDIKTTRCANISPFSKQSYQLGYHLQMYMYQEGIKAVSGYPPAEITWPRIAAIEKDPPYDVYLFTMEADQLEQGRYAFRDIVLPKLTPCLASGHWPGYPGGEIELPLPPWAGHEIVVDADTRLAGSEPAIFGEGAAVHAKPICETCSLVIFKKGQKIWRNTWQDVTPDGNGKTWDRWVCLHCARQDEGEPGAENEDDILAL